MNPQSIQLTVPADVKFSSILRQISQDIFMYVGFTREWADRLKLVTDELFMNANLYGSKNSLGKIYLSYSFDEQVVHFSIEDEGSEKSLKAEELKELIQKNSSEATDMSKTSGRGLALISRLWTDSMTIEDSQRGGLHISFSKKISNEVPPSPYQQQESVNLPSSGPITLLKISGQIDATNMEEKIRPVLDHMTQVKEGDILKLDCSELTYFNSTFIGYLVAWFNDLQKKHAHLVLKNVVGSTREVLDLVGLSKVIYIEK